jgi:uncharacterized membrane protein YeaQ/YmgE (transglycosylase-associated protein family)
MGFIKTTVLGIAGAFVGGFLASLIFHQHAYNRLEPSGFVGAVVGAVVIMGVTGLISRR